MVCYKQLFCEFWNQWWVLHSITKYFETNKLEIYILSFIESLITDFIHFLALLPNFCFWKGDWALDHVWTQFRDCTKMSLFSRLFDNSWGISYIQFIGIMIYFRFTCGKRKLDSQIMSQSISWGVAILLKLVVL